MLRRKTRIMVFFLVVYLNGLSTAASVPPGLTQATFNDAAREVDRLKQKEGAKQAASEIAVAEQWIERGRLLQREGKTKKASFLAQKLNVQLRYVRALVFLGASLEVVKKLEKENGALEEELRLLKHRLRRLMLQKDGAKLSSAEPSLEGNSR